MEEPYGPALVQNLNDLQELLLSEESLETSLERVAILARATVRGCDSAGITLKNNGNARTAAATDEFTLKIDRDQYDNHEGPCLEALNTKTTILVEDTELDDRWPNFAAAAARDGLASSLSLPLSVREEGTGALNLYARTKNAFGSESMSVGRLFASQASVALSNAQTYAASMRLAEQLREAIASREVIGKAKGILIAKEGVNDEQAFEMLKKVSQSQNVKLRDIAQRIVDEAQR